MTKPTRPAERSFGLVVGGLFAAMAAYQGWRGRAELARGLFAAGILLSACGAFAPGLLKGPRRLWFAIGHMLGWINARILLTLLFLVVITPVGLAMRLFGRDPLRRCWRDRRGGWSPYPASRRDTRHYERMY